MGRKVELIFCFCKKGCLDLPLSWILHFLLCVGLGDLTDNFCSVHENPDRAFPYREDSAWLNSSRFIPPVLFWSCTSGGRVQCSSCRSPAVTFVLAWCILQVLLQLKIWAWILETQTLVSWLLFCVHFLHLWSRVTSTSCNEQFVIQGSISLIIES